jgi:hypothetical protein
MINECEEGQSENWYEKTEVIGESLLQCHVVHHKSHSNCQVLKPGCQCRMSVTNHLIDGTAPDVSKRDE